MTSWRKWFLVGPRDVRADVNDEIAYHLAELTAKLIAEGLSPDAARAEATRRFGATERIRAHVLEQATHAETRRRRIEGLRELAQDLRFGLRIARRQPGFTAALVLVLGLGIGAHTAIATAFHAVLLRPLPYHEPGRLVHLWETAPDLLGGRSEASWPDFLDWRAQTGTVFSGVEGYDETNMVRTGEGAARQLPGVRVTTGFLTLLGVRPALGRDLLPGEDLPGGASVAILSHGFWTREFGADTGALGKGVTLNGRAYEIVGVLPRDFQFGLVGDLDFLIPLDRAENTRGQRFNHWLNVVARLREGASVEQARTAMQTVEARITQADPGNHAQRSALVVPLQEVITGQVRPILVALAGAVTVLLLIACSNAGSLLLARALARAPELKVRAALGAGRGRLVRQLATEAVAIALVAGAAGVVLARFGLAALIGAIPPGVLGDVPALRDVRPSLGVLGYALGVSLLTGLLFGVIPGLGLSRTLAPAQMGKARRTGVARDVLVTVQLALTTVLLVTAGLLVRSLVRLTRSDPGFSTEQTVTFRYSLSGERYQPGWRQQQFAEQLLGRVRALPEVRSAGAVTSLPLQPGGTNTLRVEGRPEPMPSERPEATMRGVAGDYFQAIGIPVLHGRVFARDDSTTPWVIVMDESMARRLFQRPEDAVGARVRFYAFPDSAWTVVGVVGATKTGNLDEPPRPTIYYTHLQAAENRLSIVVRLAGDPAPMLASARSLVAELDRDVPFYAAETLEERIARSPAVFSRRYPLILIGGFGVAAALLSMTGLYAILAHAVVTRTREIGIRAALGATPARLARFVVERGGIPVLVGTGAGLLGALAASRGVSSLLYGVSPGDPVTIGGVGLLLIAIALGGVWLPARRAARMSPLVALKAE